MKHLWSAFRVWNFWTLWGCVPRYDFDVFGVHVQNFKSVKLQRLCIPIFGLIIHMWVFELIIYVVCVQDVSSLNFWKVWVSRLESEIFVYLYLWVNPLAFSRVSIPRFAFEVFGCLCSTRCEWVLWDVWGPVFQVLNMSYLGVCFQCVKSMKSLSSVV